MSDAGNIRLGAELRFLHFEQRCSAAMLQDGGFTLDS
jgi:hypothetical protein